MNTPSSKDESELREHVAAVEERDADGKTRRPNTMSRVQRRQRRRNFNRAMAKYSKVEVRHNGRTTETGVHRAQ